MYRIKPPVEPNHREQFVYDNQDRLSLKELAQLLHVDINCICRMKRAANKFYGRQAKKKRIAYPTPNRPILNKSKT